MARIIRIQIALLFSVTLLVSCGDLQDLLHPVDFRDTDYHPSLEELFEEYKKDIKPTQHIDAMYYNPENPRREEGVLAVCSVISHLGIRYAYIEFFFEKGDFPASVEKLIAYHEFGHCANDLPHDRDQFIMRARLPVEGPISDRTMEIWIEQMKDYEADYRAYPGDYRFSHDHTDCFE